MAALVRGYDASSVQAPLLAALTALGACDVAFALSRSQAATQARLLACCRAGITSSCMPAWLRAVLPAGT